MPDGLTCTRRQLLAGVWLLAGSRGLARAVFDAVNRERTRAKLPPLKWDSKLAAVARSHSERMRKLGFFSHQDPQRGDPGRRLAAAGLHPRVFGENIYSEDGMRDPVASAVRGWMRSSEHRRSILDAAFNRTGVGVAGSGGQYWFTQLFAGDRW